MRENRTYGSEGGEGQNPSRPPIKEERQLFDIREFILRQALRNVALR